MLHLIPNYIIADTLYFCCENKAKQLATSRPPFLYLFAPAELGFLDEILGLIFVRMLISAEILNWVVLILVKSFIFFALLGVSCEEQPCLPWLTTGVSVSFMVV